MLIWFRGSCSVTGKEGVLCTTRWAFVEVRTGIELTSLFRGMISEAVARGWSSRRVGRLVGTKGLLVGDCFGVQFDSGMGIRVSGIHLLTSKFSIIRYPLVSVLSKGQDIVQMY